MLFKDRYDAALQLIPHLKKYNVKHAVILAVPRGGVPIGYHIAKKYNMPLEILLTKKIGHPWNEELAIGAVSLEGQIIDKRHNIPMAYIENEIKIIRQSLYERYEKFMGNRTPIDVKDKVVIIVDDGIATGNTLLAAIKMIRQKHPEKIVVAVPVAPFDTAEQIEQEVDDLICIHKIQHFTGVGGYYDDFSQVDDEEVIELLKVAPAIKNEF
jgi:putative phosphoribosyl transferase